MHNLTPSGFFTDPVPTLDDGDPVAASSTTPTSQSLCDRTAFTQGLLALAQGLSTTTTAGGTTTLTAASNERQYFGGSANQNIVLPDETTIPSGKTFFIFQNSTGVLTFKDSGGSTVLSVPPKIGSGRYELVLITSINNATSTGNWKYFFNVPGQQQGTNTNDSSISGAVGETVIISTDEGSAVSLSSSSPAAVGGGPLSLSAGAWRISGYLGFTLVSVPIGGYSVGLSVYHAGVHIPGSLPTTPNSSGDLGMVEVFQNSTASANWGRLITIPQYVIGVAFGSSANLTLSAIASFGGGSAAAWGFMMAERAR